jgi:hypothetical protein
MASRAVSQGPVARPGKSLVVRAGLARTFGSLTSFVAVTLLFAGIYVLADAFAHPMTAEAAALIFAAFAIAMASILLYYLPVPHSAIKRQHHRRRHTHLLTNRNYDGTRGISVRPAEWRGSSALREFCGDESGGPL